MVFPDVSVKLRDFRRPIVGLVVMLILASASIAFAQAERFAADELLIGFRAGVSRAHAEAVYRGFGAVKLEELSQINVHRIRVPAQALSAVETALSHRPEVKFIERNGLVPLSFYPDDPRFPDQWHLFKINAQQAWDISPGAPDVTVAILDSGIEPTHPDLQPHLIPGYSPYDRSSNTADVYGHGTQVAGTAAAIGNNGIGVSGVAASSAIMPIRVSDSSGYALYSAVASGILWAVDHGARVLNASIGGIEGSSTVTSAAQYGRSRGAVIVGAAGNCGCYNATPENPYIISVGATDSNDNRASFSSQGSYVDISAPGVGMYTTAPGGGYSAPSGTSVASPVVAGVVALMLSANPQLTPSDVDRLLKSTAIDLGPQGWDPGYGAGRVDAYRAVAAASASTASRDTVPPTVAIMSPHDGTTLVGGATAVVSTSDNSGVARAELYFNDKLFASDSSAPFEFYVDTTKYPNGLYKLSARAVDLSGNVGNSNPVSITINNVSSSDTTTPTVSITTISELRNKLSVAVSGTDDTGVVKVELYVDGRLQATSTSLPTTFYVNSKKLSSGTHVFVAKAYDSAGRVGSSSPVSFTTK